MGASLRGLFPTSWCRDQRDILGIEALSLSPQITLSDLTFLSLPPPVPTVGPEHGHGQGVGL